VKDAYPILTNYGLQNDGKFESCFGFTRICQYMVLHKGLY